MTFGKANGHCPECGAKQYNRCYGAHLVAWWPGRDGVVACSNCQTALRFQPNRSPHPPLAGILGLVPLLYHTYVVGVRTHSPLPAVGLSIGIVVIVSVLRSRIKGSVEFASRDEKIPAKSG
ncbi:hypothetical protein CEE69_26705 [Rhodopirellula bahusiensis]|uniref:Uncharacterized protein n=1 Tax=Rhodopirellula bahusiensis TaxID=2014065 RepID=A0A2G1W0L5_9BACT|nr:hypothetical protein CEE69_26705 [Rhodopirellula bahusiensis]